MAQRMAISVKARHRNSVRAHSTIEEMDENKPPTTVPTPETRIEKQLSKAEIGLQSRGMGSKRASLYLSRSASLAPSAKFNGEEKREEIQEVDEQKNDYSSKRTSMSSLSREFTFTGYDIMSDVGDVNEKQESPEERFAHAQVQCYENACKMMGIVPVKYISRHINDKELVMRSHPLGPQGARAVCIALVSNRTVEKLDFEDNDIGTQGAISITDMLTQNDTITEVRIAENWIGSGGAMAFTELLKSGKNLHTLDISGSGLTDSDAKYVADMIEFNSHLRVLDVSHNRLSDGGAFAIGRAIAINDTLQELDLSWNHIRGKGSLAIALGVQKNVAIKKLNISWNGFALEGAKGLGKALEENRSLKELDVSNNRLEAKAVGEFLKGLQENDTLSTLRIGQNPFSPEVALVILKAIGDSDKCVVTKLDLTDIVVRADFLTTWDEIKMKRTLPLHIMFGAVVKSLSVPVKDPNALDWRDPVVRLFKYMHDNGYRVIDMLKSLDKDGSLSVDRQEFKRGFLTADSPLTEDQLDEVMTRLDTDGDGEVDLGELLKGEKEFRRKMHLRMRKLMNQGKAERMDSVVQKLMEIETL